MTEDILLPGFGIRGYRSFGTEVQRFAPLSRMTVLIGKNNCGKSNVLRFLRDYFAQVVENAHRNREQEFDPSDRPRGSSREGVVFALARPTAPVLEGLSSQLNSHQLEFVHRILTSTTLGQDDLFWTYYRWETQGSRISIDGTLVEALAEEEVLANREWEAIARKLTSSGGAGGLKKQHIPGTLMALGAAKQYSAGTPPVKFIPAIREIEKPGDGMPPESGAEIIQRLAAIQNPDPGERDRRRDFEKLTDFVRKVTGQPDAGLEVTYSRDQILVQMNDRELPLRALGSGIHEVVILAAAATVVEDSLICMEEPEVHLHPTLQRRLVEYLLEDTSNQYIIATHSAHFIDADDVSVFHLELDDGWSSVDTTVTGQDRFRAVYDLGYKASDLLQANCILWVEGPSDRIYLNHWLGELDPELVEGVDYSIMFYGGSLRSHLSADEDRAVDDQALEDFILLQRLNRHVGFVMDSDRKKKGEKRTASKQRIESEIESIDGFVWTTDGREIENYIPSDLMLQAIQLLDSDAESLVWKDKYRRAYRYKREDEDDVRQPNKVDLARAVSQLDANLEHLDLQLQLDRLISFIRKANE